MNELTCNWENMCNVENWNGSMNISFHNILMMQKPCVTMWGHNGMMVYLSLDFSRFGLTETQTYHAFQLTDNLFTQSTVDYHLILTWTFHQKVQLSSMLSFCFIFFYFSVSLFKNTLHNSWGKGELPKKNHTDRKISTFENKVKTQKSNT